MNQEITRRVNEERSPERLAARDAFRRYREENPGGCISEEAFIAIYIEAWKTGHYHCQMYWG